MNEKMVDVLIHYSNQTCCKCLSSVILVSVIKHGHGSEILTNLGPQKYLQVAFLAKKMCFPHQHISNTILLAIQIKYQMFENWWEQFGGRLEFTLRWTRMSLCSSMEKSTHIKALGCCRSFWGKAEQNNQYHLQALTSLIKYRINGKSLLRLQQCYRQY